MKPFTVGDLLRTSGLELRLVGGGDGLDRPIRWAHVSELDDPTPWLKGGELLLTTGMSVGTTAAAHRAYLDRLVGADLAGLGFGTGFSHRVVPRALARAADHMAFPVFEVPYEVPFIAITEAVFTRVAAQQYELLSRSLDAEHVLTRAVLDGQGIQGVLAALARAVQGWAIMVDLHGSPIAASPAAARAHLPMVTAALRSPRAEGHRFGLSVVERGQHVSIQPVEAQGRTEAILAVGKRQALTQFERVVSSHALALLALELAKARAVAEAERRLKGDLLDQVVRGAVSATDAATSFERLGFDPWAPLSLTVLSSDAGPDRLALACEEVLAREAGPFLCSARQDLVVVVTPPAEGFVARFRAAVAARVPGIVLAGAGSPVPVDRLSEGLREARYALRVCRTEGRLHAEFADLGTYRLLLSLQDPGALRAFADSVLAPLDRYDREHGGDLIASLRAFLDRNARWETAAKDLFVHRHTLRYRMRKVEELTGRDLGSARDRMELFLALRAREMQAGDGDASGRLPGTGPGAGADRRRRNESRYDAGS